MTQEEAKDLLGRLRQVADTVIASIPIGYYPQDEYAGNPYERHIVDNWTDARVKEVFGDPSWSAIEGEIGVYVWGVIKELPSIAKPLKIAVYAISKNEEAFVERFCNSAKEADYVVIADTGSTDGTVAAANAAGCIVHNICISPWRFDLARNAALALVPADADICISLDLDEILEPGWREEMERVWTDKVTRLRYFFDWGCGIKFKYEKIHARKGYMWHHPCHEYPIPDPRTAEVWAETDMLMVSHHPDPHKSRGQYLDLLAVSVKEDPRCPRNAFYYARELSFYRKWDEAIAACNKYLAMPEATWPNERCYAYRVLGQCYEEKGMQWEAEGAYHKACAEAPNTREPWCALSLLKYRQSQWAESYAAAMRALSIKDRQLVYTCDPEVWGFKPHDLASIAAWHLGLKEVSIEQAKLAVEAAPDNLRLKANLDFVMGIKAEV
jgi:tetratricopeptide (TPR) repeat protein